jgi:ADP-ribose pyrophosphatase YjhB (NUDIX family)
MIKDFHFCPFCGAELVGRELEGRNRQCCPECDYVHFKNPLPSAAGVLLRGKKILLIKRGIEPGKGHWSLPSGFIEEGETPEEGCIREVREETGLETKVKKLLDIFHVRSNFYGEILVIVYLLEEIGGELQAGTDAQDVRFYTMDDMPYLHVKGFTNVLTEILPCQDH